MSYLGFPRLQFAGAFFTNPSNLNNKTVNYSSALDGGRLIYDTGPYNNPNGVAQFYFYECRITQIIGADALPIADDPLLGARIDTASPAHPAATFAKIVDLDPDMQFRTELYGVRLYIQASGDCGLSASVAVPQLRDRRVGIRISVQWRWTSRTGRQERTAGYGAPLRFSRR